MTPTEGTKLAADTGETWTLASSDGKSVMQVPMSQPSFDPGTLYYVPTEFVNGYGPAYPETSVTLNGDIHATAASGIQESTTPPVEGTTTKDALPPAELKRLVRQQFEYYFSRENLANDAYLVSQMDGDQFVPIATVARFNQIKKLTSDMGLIVEAIRESPYIQLNETGEKVRANMKRCIVILREIPDTTPVEEIEALFDAENCPRWTNCEFAHNNSWYVTFESEEHAHKAYRYLREEVRTFKGRPIMARIKAKTLLSRTVFLPKNGVRTSTQQVESTTQPPITHRQFNTITMSTPVLTAQQTYPPVYSPNSIMPAPWLGSQQQFFTSEVHPQASTFQTNLLKTSKGMNAVVTRQFFPPNKSRPPPKTFPREQTDRSLDKEDRQSSYRRSMQPHISNGPLPLYRKEPENPHRRPNLRNKKNEEGPRFQRLKQERERRQFEQQARKEEEDMLHLDLAPENFPALPSPSSPNEKAQIQRTASLKELATNALEKVQIEAKDEPEVEVLPTPSLEKETVVAKPDVSPVTPTATCVESLASSSKPSYAQMAQKPLTKSNQQLVVKELNLPALQTSDTVKSTSTGPFEQGNNQTRKTSSSSSPKPQRAQRQGKVTPELSKGSNTPGISKAGTGIPSNDDSMLLTVKTATKDSYAARSVQNVPVGPKSNTERVRTQPPRPLSAPPHKNNSQSSDASNPTSQNPKGGQNFQGRSGHRQPRNQSWRMQHNNSSKTRDDSSIKLKLSDVPHKDETAEDNRSI